MRRFVLFYLSAGIVAGFVHVLFFSDSTDPVIGASGAISGVFGAVLMLMRHVGSLPSLLPVAGIWIALNVFFGMFGGTPRPAASRSRGRRISAAVLRPQLAVRLLLCRDVPPREARGAE